jgi:hypothetical protein
MAVPLTGQDHEELGRETEKRSLYPAMEHGVAVSSESWVLSMEVVVGRRGRCLPQPLQVDLRWRDWGDGKRAMRRTEEAFVSRVMRLRNAGTGMWRGRGRLSVQVCQP